MPKPITKEMLKVQLSIVHQPIYAGWRWIRSRVRCQSFLSPITASTRFAITSVRCSEAKEKAEKQARDVQQALRNIFDEIDEDGG